ncbi:class I SAM-dependent methyltransferase [bacterium]|nr:class I SAM-dependent methyltransferase [bacterium]
MKTVDFVLDSGEVIIEISKQNCSNISTLANQIEDDKSIKNVKIVYNVNDPIKFDKARELVFSLISQLRTKNIEIYNIPACIFRPDEVDEFYLKVKDRFVFLPICDGCLKRKVCCGLSEEYLKKYGCAELRKIDKNYMDEYFTKRNEDVEIQRLKLYYDFFLRYINGSILDAGCGSGLMLKFSKNVFGTDKTKEKIRGPIKERFVISDLENIPFKDNTFECVFCRFVLEHLKLKEIDKTIKEFYRILRPDGKIFIEFDNHKTVLDNFVGHLGEVTPDYMENLLSKSGFKLVRLFPSQLIKNFKHFNFSADINSYSYLKPKSMCIIAKK